MTSAVGRRPMAAMMASRLQIVSVDPIRTQSRHGGGSIFIVVRDQAHHAISSLVEPLERPEAHLERIEPARADDTAVGAANGVGHMAHGGIELRVLHELALARAAAVQQGQQHGHGPQQSVARILIGRRRQGRVELAGYLVCHADVAGQHGSEALAQGERSARTPAGRMEVDERGIHSTHTLVVQAQPFGGPRAEIVVHHVRPPQETLDGLAQSRVLEVGSQGPFVRLSRVKGSLQPRELVPEDGFQLDHIGAQIGEQPRRVRPGVVGAEIQDPDVRQQRAVARGQARIGSLRLGPARQVRPHALGVLTDRGRRHAHSPGAGGQLGADADLRARGPGRGRRSRPPSRCGSLAECRTPRLAAGARWRRRPCP